jgi:hypothetical protein
VANSAYSALAMAQAQRQKLSFETGGDFMVETRRDVEAYLGSRRTVVWGRVRLYAKAPVAFALLATSWAVLIFARPGVAVGVLCVAGLVLGAVLIGFCVQHDANHGA